jgi:HEAT repeat protein
MGLFGRLFGSGKEGDEAGKAAKSGPSPQVARLLKKASNKYGQAQDRQAALNALAELGTEEAVEALLQRYTFRIEQTIGDEEEKRSVFEALVRLGPSTVPPILRFLGVHNAPYWPTKALTEIVGADQTVTHLIALIETMEAVFDRDIERKVELVSNLRQFKDPRVRDVLMGFLQDDNEEFRVQALEGLADLGSDEMGDVLVERLLDEAETQRVKTAILDLLIDRKWKVKRHKDAIRKVIPDAFWIDDVGVIHRR